MSLKNSIYYYRFGKKSKKGLIQMFCITIISLATVQTGVSTYDNINNNLKVPSYLEVGDLLFCDVDQEFINRIQNFGIEVAYVYIGPDKSDDHVAMYIGDNMFIEASSYHYNSDNGKLYGVVKTGIGLLKLWSKNIIYGKIEATVEQKEKAVEWALNQLGQPYQSDYINKNDDPADTNDQYSDEWYCTELIWAAYKNQGINLDEDITEGDAVSIKNIKESKYISLYPEQINDNSKVNLDLNLAIMCLLDLREDKQNI